MNCEEAQTFRDRYLDAELESGERLRVEQHLGTCPACARDFPHYQNLNRALKAGLNRAEPTPEVWTRIESLVAHVPEPSHRSNDRIAASGLLGGAWVAVQRGINRAPRAWAALGVVWLLIFGLHFTAREPGSSTMAAHDLPSPGEVRLALRENYKLVTELAMTAEPAPAPKPKTTVPGPRSERPTATCNS